MPVSETPKLSVEERLRLVEIVWESLAADFSAVPVNDVHRMILDERIAGTSVHREVLVAMQSWQRS